LDQNARLLQSVLLYWHWFHFTSFAFVPLVFVSVLAGGFFVVVPHEFILQFWDFLG